MGKINQFTMILHCKCVGRPSSGTTDEQNKGGRINCKRSIEIPIQRSDGGPMSINQGLITKETQPFLDAAGWKKLKTLGNFQRLCPSCSDFVMKMRARDKSRWG